jgi:hypothetical protein
MAQQVGHLYRRGLAREDRQSTPGRVSSQIDQHVDVVRTDHLRSCRVVDARDVAPLIGQPSESRRDSVGCGNIGITEQLDRSAVMRRQQRLGEPCDGVAAEVRGHVTDAQPAIGNTADAELRCCGQQLRGMYAVPFAILPKYRLRGQVGTVVQRVQEIAVGSGVIRIADKRLPAALLGFGVTSLRLQHDRQVRQRTMTLM